jgi:hypothetical protein
VTVAGAYTVELLVRWVTDVAVLVITTVQVLKLLVWVVVANTLVVNVYGTTDVAIKALVSGDVATIGLVDAGATVEFVIVTVDLLGLVHSSHDWEAALLTDTDTDTDTETSLAPDVVDAA